MWNQIFQQLAWKPEKSIYCYLKYQYLLIQQVYLVNKCAPYWGDNEAQ